MLRKRFTHDKIKSMKNIKNVLICGIGAIGSIYAKKLGQQKEINLKVLVDEKRLQKYTAKPQIFNGEKLDCDYILPNNKEFFADLIIIATKYDGLENSIQNIKNFVTPETIIISLLNGVDSEEKIASKYTWNHVLLSYFIGHSAMRADNIITHDGVGKIVFGLDETKSTDKNDIERLKTFFDKTGIDYIIPVDMKHSLWLKFLLNVSTNQPSAILGLTFGQMQSSITFKVLFDKIINEVIQIAKAQGVKNTQKMPQEAEEIFKTMCPEGKTSMLQDVESCRKTEVDMFAGHIIELGKKYNIPTPYNTVMKEMLDIIYEKCRRERGF